MEVYLDNAATTRVLDEAAQAMMEMLTSTYGNPSSLHDKGFAAEKKIEEARQVIANTLKVNKKTIYFTSGGTEGNNTLLYGAMNAYKREGKHVLVSDIEHPSVREAALAYEEEFDVELIPVDDKGYVDIKVLTELLRPDTILVSIMHVNNEIGTIQDLDALIGVIKERSPKAKIHVDAVQSFGKYTLHPERIGVDMMTISAHKIHGPKGVGAIYVNQGCRLKPLFYGGSQQKGIRSGTENVPGIVGFGIAAREAYKHLDERKQHISEVRDLCIEELKKIEGISFNSDIEKGAYHILNIRVEGVKSEVLLHSLEEQNIYVSTGSACSSNKKNHSTTLQAMRQSSDATDQAIRLSFSFYNSKEDVKCLAQQLTTLTPMLRRFRRK